ncbi:MAG: hypothetical protein JWN76_2221 [Chitinophagaceae bacterium]|nr:hypothetical protein [Chitinophagaceae bacterium]
MKFIKLRLATLLGLSVLLFNACKKVELTKELGDRGQTIVKFMTAPTSSSHGLNYNLTNFQIATTPQVVDVVDIRRDVPSEAELSKTMVVTVKDDPAAIAAYNNANGTSLVALPTSAYTIDASNPKNGTDYTVTFGPGEFAKPLKISLTNASTLDLTKSYAIGLTIVVAVTGADGRVSFDNRTTVVELGPLNKYDGVYKLSGSTLRAGDPDKTGTFSPVEMKLITIAANDVIYNDLQVWADGTGVGIGQPVLSVNPATNKVTVTSSGGATNVPGPLNYYDPATKTFYLDFTWSTGIASRRATVTLQYLRPR